LSQRKLQAWQDAGLIDAETVRRILDHESAHAKPLGLWAIIGIGALAIGLGLISVVAANWDEIAGTIRLAIHFSLMIGAAGWLFWQYRSEDDGGIGKRFFSDAGLFILGALALTFFGHLGQVYQTSSPLWQPLLFWLVLFTPALLMLGRGWFAALAWMAAVAGTAVSFAEWYVGKVGELPALYGALLLSIPPLVVAGAAWMRAGNGRSDFWLRLEQIALTLTVISVALFHLLAELTGGQYSGTEFRFVSTAMIQIVTFGLAAAAILLMPEGRGEHSAQSRRAVAIILVAAAISNLLAALNGGFSEALAAIIFMGFWAVIAGVSLHANWRAIFQAAIGILAIRLIVLSFQLGIDLLGSGVGLILAGLLTLGIAWGAVRFSRQYAPLREAVSDAARDNSAPGDAT